MYDGPSKAVSVRTLVLPEPRAQDARFARLIELAERRGCRVAAVARGDTVRAGPHVARVLAPEVGWSDASENDLSVVIAVVLDGKRLLMTGDAERSVERFLCESGDDISSDVLKLGHHGSSTSSGRPFLLRARPRAAVISVGAGNKYGLPDAQVLARLDSLGVAVLRTDVEGAALLSVVGGAGRLVTVAGGTVIEL